MPKCTINGQEVEVKEGATIIEAFKASGQDIAHYCWHPGLSIAGVCRLCMVDVEGNPRVQIACNTTVQEGMVITNQSEKIQEAVKWGLDFHLINHPLDCPICDQAGECGLQEQYMKFGQNDSKMAESKVKKKKVVDLGPKIVLDSERCILCSRCVRFTDEVSKTQELGIFNRGDRSEIGTFEGKELDNDYAYNTVDICPVGALTSKDFRFKQRVWYLKNADSICNGCSTGCNIKAYYNEEGLFRIKPVENEEVNGYWMCDKGRDLYKSVNKPNRILRAFQATGAEVKQAPSAKVLEDALSQLSGEGQTALVLTGHETNEEIQALISAFGQRFSKEMIFHWAPFAKQADEFDGLLLRGDKVANTAGLKKSFEQNGLQGQSWEGLSEMIKNGKVNQVIFSAPENMNLVKDKSEVFNLLQKLDVLVWLGSQKEQALEGLSKEVYALPVKTSLEKSGSFTNYAGVVQKFEPVSLFVEDSIGLDSVAQALSQGEVEMKSSVTVTKTLKSNYFLSEDR